MTTQDLAAIARKAINFNYKAQQEVLRKLKSEGVKVPNLNSSSETFRLYFSSILEKFINEKTLTLEIVDFRAMAESHYTTALWSSSDVGVTGEDIELDDYVLRDTAKLCLDYDLVCFLIKLDDICVTLEHIEEKTEQDPERVAHDFWLTRNHHGAGFWDGDYKEDYLGDTLTTIAHSFGECNLYLNDDGLVYVY